MRRKLIMVIICVMLLMAATLVVINFPEPEVNMPHIEESSREVVPDIGLHKAMFWEEMEGDKVRCMLCFHKCVIPPGMPGICRVRINHEGGLYTVVYGRPAGLQTDPIEAEPMYHMIPGHRNLGVFTASCNFRCKQCHNWHITQR